MPRQIARTVPLALLLTALSACGHEEAPPSADTSAASTAEAATEAPPSASGDHPEPCSWLSSETATGILGAAVTVSRPAGYTTPCHVESSPFTWGGTLVVHEGDDLTSAASMRGMTPENTLDAAASVLGRTLEPVDGLGERAGWAVTTPDAERNGNGELLVEQGGRVFSIALRSSAGSPVRAKAVALARAIISEQP